MSKFTEKQRAVIDHDFGNIVVSASAGSGKTSVMIERLIRLIEEDKASVKDILAVTFTRMAASEMREKLSKAIIQKIKEGKDVKRMKEELDNISSASISTIDSFLNGLIKKYFYLVDVDPSFSIVAEGEQKIIQATALDEVLERLYDEGGEHIERLTSVFNRGRSDRNLREQILKVYEFIESQTDEFAYLEYSLSNYSKEGVKRIEEWFVERFRKRLQAVFRDISKLDDKAKEVSKKFYDFCEALIAEALAFLQNPSVESCRIYSLYTPLKPRLVKSDSLEVKEISEEAALVLERVKAIKADIKAVFLDGEEERIEKAKASGEILESLIFVVKLFYQEYSQLKREKNLLDYSDLSHFAYRLLQIKEVQNDVKSTYKFVLVDEYQDTNGIQEAIFQLLKNGNQFIVGDVKQSIYGFRGCDSSIFQSRIEVAEQVSAHVELDWNFRSAKSVIDSVNKVFSCAMTVDSFGVDYKSHPMVYGRLYGDYNGEATVYYVDEKKEKTKAPNMGVYSIEKGLKEDVKTSQKIEGAVRLLVEKSLNKSIFDVKEGRMRPVEYKDIAILVRKNKGIADRVLKELDMAGIPVLSESKRSIGDYPEIAAIINILECIYTHDNDVALCAALKSPMGGLSDKELLTVRQDGGEGSFFKACNKCMTRADLIGAKLRSFFDYLKDIRLLANFEGAPTIVRRIMNEKDFYSKILSERGGELKLKRIERFLAEGRKGDEELSVGDFLDALSTSLSDMTLSSGGGDNAVKIVSMHSSKGLEYPVVIIAELAEQWNRVDAKSEIRLDRVGGVGLKYYDHATKKAEDNIVCQYVKALKGDGNFKDELRLLYVAMTRAKCILNVVVKKPLQEEHVLDLSKVSSHVDLLAQSDMDYVDFEVEERAFEKEERRKPIIPEPEKSLVDEMKSFVSFSYPYEKDTRLSLKRSVTAVTKSGLEKEEDLYFEIAPIFGGSDVETGNAYHRFLELVDFEKINDNGYIDGLLDSNLLKNERNILQKEVCLNILKSSVFEKLKGYKLYREQPFIVTVPPLLAFEEGSDDVLLQGTIDLLAIKNGRAIIVDYKHSGARRQTLVERYKKQLELYAYAVEKSLNVEVEALYILNLKTALLIEL